MTSFRIFFNALLVMLLVFAFGVFLGPKLSQRPPVQLAIPSPVVDEFSDASVDEGNVKERATASLRSRVRKFENGIEVATVIGCSFTDQSALQGVDLEGRLHRVGESDECRAVVIVFLGTECPIANSSIPRLNELAEQCRQKKIEFFGVLSSPTLSHREVAAHSREFDVRFPMLFDGLGDLRERLNATHSPHAFVLTPSGDVLYQGAIDDQFVSPAGRRRNEPRQLWLRDAVTAVMSGKPIETSQTEPVGCLLPPLSQGQQPTFERDIAPLVFTKCANCHQAGSVAPFSLTCYEELQKHSAQSRIMVEHQQMPPWRPQVGFGQFRNELCLSGQEIKAFKQWVELGMPRGDAAHHWEISEWKALSNRHSTAEAHWQLGEPDLVLKVSEPFRVPADGPDIYQYFVIPTGLTEDRLIAAIEYRSSNMRVVHHASFRFDDAGNARRLDNETPDPGYRRFGGWGFETGGTLGGWAFGLSPQKFPQGLGRPIKAGSDFVLQTHYHPTGKPETEQAEIGIHFAAPQAQRRIGELIIADQRLLIPANDERFVHRTAYELPVAVTAYSVLPHTHLLGREIAATAVLPNGVKEELIFIDDWRFNWQNQYFFKQPHHWPAGTRIEFEVIFDNSAANPLNPHAVPQWVSWGEETTQEMAVLFIDVATETNEQLDRLLKHNRAVQSAQPARPVRR